MTYLSLVRIVSSDSSADGSHVPSALASPVSRGDRKLRGTY